MSYEARRAFAPEAWVVVWVDEDGWASMPIVTVLPGHPDPAGAARLEAHRLNVLRGTVAE